MTHKLIKTDNYLLVVDDSYIRDVRPFKGRWHLEHGRTLNMFPNYLTDLSLCKLVIAHLPLKGSPILEGIDLLPPYSRHQEDGVDDAVMRFKESYSKLGVTDFELSAFSEGYNKAREKYVYTEEDVRKAITMARDLEDWQDLVWEYEYDDIIQSLHQYPTEFECEMEDYGHYEMGVDNFIKHGEKPKAITTAQGVQWVGKYK